MPENEANQLTSENNFELMDRSKSNNDKDFKRSDSVKSGYSILMGTS